MFNSMVLKPVISAIVSPVAGAVTGAMGLSGTASAATGMTSFADLIGHLHNTPHYAIIVAPLTIALLILLQAEAARIPVDDPMTHLELTMIHEVMILDHSGPELAAMQYSAALAMWERGFYVRWGGDTLQFAPPFVTQKEDLDKFAPAKGKVDIKK